MTFCGGNPGKYLRPADDSFLHAKWPLHRLWLTGRSVPLEVGALGASPSCPFDASSFRVNCPLPHFNAAPGFPQSLRTVNIFSPVERLATALDDLRDPSAERFSPSLLISWQPEPHSSCYTLRDTSLLHFGVIPPAKQTSFGQPTKRPDWVRPPIRILGLTSRMPRARHVAATHA